MSETQTRQPFMRWKFWLPCVLLAGAGGLVLAVLADSWSSFGYGFALLAPFVVGLSLGYGVRRINRAFYILILVIFVASMLLGVISFGVAGLICGLVALAIFIVPVMLGILSGVLLRVRLRQSSFSQRWYLPVLALFALSGGVLYVEPLLTPEHPLETIETTRVLDIDRQTVWESILFFEEVRSQPPMLARIGLPRPLYTTGNIRREGDLKRCVYNTGHLVKRVTQYRPGETLAFDVVEQQGIEDRSVRLVSGSFQLATDERGRTRVTLTTVYEPLLDARPIWRPFEIRLARTLHWHVLDGLELEARRNMLSLIAEQGATRR